MDGGAEDRHGGIPSRHPLVTLPFGAILTFVGAKRRRAPRDGGRGATIVAEPAPTVADRAIIRLGTVLGPVLAGVVVQQAGLVPTIVGMGALYLLMPLSMFFNRSLRQMDAIRLPG